MRTARDTRQALNFACFAVVIVLGIGEVLLVVVRRLPGGNCSAHGQHKIQTPQVISELVGLAVLVSVFALASGSFSAETSELNFCGLQETEFFRVPRTRFLPSYGFVRDARVGIRGARLDSRVIYRSHAYKIETPTSGESSGPIMGH